MNDAKLRILLTERYKACLEENYEKCAKIDKKGKKLVGYSFMIGKIREEIAYDFDRSIGTLIINAFAKLENKTYLEVFGEEKYTN